MLWNVAVLKHFNEVLCQGNDSKCRGVAQLVQFFTERPTNHDVACLLYPLSRDNLNMVIESVDRSPSLEQYLNPPCVVFVVVYFEYEKLESIESMMVDNDD